MRDTITTINVLIADDHFIVRSGVRAMLEDTADIRVVAEAKNGREAVELFDRAMPDVALIDMRMPELAGHEVIAAIRARHKGARLIALSQYEGDDDVSRCIVAGAATYLSKRTVEDDLPNVIRAVHRGEKPISPLIAHALAARLSRPTLTPRESETLHLVARGLANKEIATRLDVSVNTVNTHVSTVLTKLGVDHRTEAVVVALSRGLIHLE